MEVLRAIAFWATLVSMIVGSRGIRCYLQEVPTAVGEMPTLKGNCDEDGNSQAYAEAKGKDNNINLTLHGLPSLAQDQPHGPPRAAAGKYFQKCVSVRNDRLHKAVYVCGNNAEGGCFSNYPINVSGQTYTFDYACFCCNDYCNDGKFANSKSGRLKENGGFIVKILLGLSLLS